MQLSNQLVRELELNYRVLMAQLDGLTHADSVLQLPFRGNCLNWVLGHIIVSRGRMLRLAGIEALWNDDDYTRYDRDSEPLTSGDEALPLERILTDLNASQERLIERIQNMQPEEFEAVPEDDDERTVGRRLAFLSWHETYHTGQTEYLRQLTGVNDKVI